MLKSSIFPILCLFFTACGTLPPLGNQKKVFYTHHSWVRRTTDTDNSRYRKINRMTPIVTSDLVIQGNGMDGLAAYQKSNGILKWKLFIQDGVEGGATLIKDRIFFGGNNGYFYSASIRDGSIVWSYQTRSENFSEPLLDAEHGVIYFLGGNNTLYALEADSGKSVWTYSRQDTNNFSIRGGTKPALYKDTLFAGFSDGSFIAFNSKSGSPLWELHLNKNKKFRDIDATPVVDGDYVYVAGFDDKLYCILSSRGEIAWRVDSGSYSGITLFEDKLFYPTSSGEILALKKSNGEKIWSYKLPKGIATSVKTYKGMIVFGESQGSLRFLDALTGKTIGSFEPGKGILSAPAIDEKNNHLYFISGEANLYALEAKWQPEKVFPYLK